MEKRFVPLVPRDRLLEIIRGYVEGQSTEISRPDMNNENHLWELAKAIVSECTARIPLWELEKNAN
jgi:hypothetical protein